MDRIAIVISGPNTSATQIAERIRRRLRGGYLEVQVFRVETKADVANVSVKGFDGVIIGGTVSDSEFAPLLSKWCHGNSVRLNSLPFGFFAIGARPAEITTGGRPSDDRTIRQILDQEGLRAGVTAGFYGAVQAKTPGLLKRILPGGAAKVQPVQMDDEGGIDWFSVMQFVDAFEKTSPVPLPRSDANRADTFGGRNTLKSPTFHGA